ncbi:DUF6477 family protein [Jannaschia seohaensis]|uniref:Uncharacterized protein n=1 Tax=Jannaschia seohaensis TaxID=475081 RepID=A0A2Y9APT5_9RHOB|nr:DUF6477 family protein [Jannaschia seohaensis]PWJ20390.1 hypothetical protein BCF38_103207 [Jannaschia seohaensis]SSA44457.1 hypothetical protein SAMN05421539_103207 [Jannaschia seohaensis]
MCRITKEINELRRPGLLVEAAAQGTALYERRRDLRRMLRVAIPATARAALEKLLPIEAELEKRRREGATNYCLPRHVDILTALLAEARSFRVG